MIRTQFLSAEDEGFKQFKPFNVFQVSSKRIDYNLRVSTFKEIVDRVPYTLGFRISRGGVHLPLANHLYCMEHLPHNCDLVLPEAQLHDWVVLFYEQVSIIEKVTQEAGSRQTFKIYSSKKQRIMGLDEPLICDMPFMSLRLTFLGDIDGWVVS